ncbi:hypothetical protein MMC25_002928 [Agyrium rufum]|nr:hypothetical protein [Agyrium rufum]
MHLYEILAALAAIATLTSAIPVPIGQPDAAAIEPLYSPTSLTYPATTLRLAEESTKRDAAAAVEPFYTPNSLGYQPITLRLADESK